MEKLWVDLLVIQSVYWMEDWMVNELVGFRDGSGVLVIGAAIGDSVGLLVGKLVGGAADGSSVQLLHALGQ